MTKSVSVPVIVVSPEDDHKAMVNTALRDAGHAAHCVRITSAADIADACKQYAPELVFVVQSTDSAEIATLRDKLPPTCSTIPVIALYSGSVDEAWIVKAMAQGARDAVSLGNIARLQAVANREIEAFRVARALQNVMQSANQYRHELDTLKQISIEAIADIQEGIIVNVNPAWLELFGYPDDTDLTGTPIMDLCATTDQPALKGGLVACQRGKWQDEKLSVAGLRADGSQLPVSFHLENTQYDGETAVRLLIKPEPGSDKTPDAMVETALHCDPVTRLYNQQHFMQVATQRLETPAKGGIRAVVFIRPDRFSRAIADLGICAADSVFVQFGQLLRESIQQSDVYARFGGTLFTVLLERGNMADVEAWTQRLLKHIENAVFAGKDRSTVLTCSAGLCELDSAEPKLEEALAEAERACRQAREQGGNRMELSESSGASRQTRQQDSIWEPRIRGALMENRFRLEQQPVAGLNEEIENAYDILVRMLDEAGNTILPSEFMPAAERTGLTKNIDRWVIGAALSFCVTNNAQLIFIRVSRDSLLDESLSSWLQAQLARMRLSPAKVCLEIEENTVISHLLQTQQLAQALRKLGVRFAIEHFGVSSESSQLLGRIPTDFIKIDGSLMQGLHKNPELQNRVKNISREAREAGVFTVAERVQDANTMAVLWQLGVAYIQGNYIQNREIVIEDTSTSTVTTRALQLSN